MEIIYTCDLIDCSGNSQTGFKWIRRLQADNGHLPSEESLQRFEEHRVAYDPKIYYATFRIPIPVEMRQRLPIPGGYQPAKGFLYAFVPQPPEEYRTITLVVVEGHRSMFILLLLLIVLFAVLRVDHFLL